MPVCLSTRVLAMGSSALFGLGWGGLAAIAVESRSTVAEGSSRAIATPPRAVVAEAKELQLSPDLKAVLAGKNLTGIITSKTPSAIRLSVPSLWWVSDQLANLQAFGNKFIQEWIAYPIQPGQPGRVDLLVNRQQWSLLDYFQRYQFVNKFSAIARSFGYNTRVYDHPDRPPIALYACNFAADEVKILQSRPLQLSPATTNQETAMRANVANQLTCQLKMPGTSLLRGR